MKQVRNIIHAVGPVVLARNVTAANRRDLGTCYTRSLELAKAQGHRSIAFPCISTAIFGFPIDEATPVALMNVHYWLSQRDNAVSMDKIVFCVFSDNDLRVYRELLPDYFDVYFDHELLDFVTTANVRGHDDSRRRSQPPKWPQKLLDLDIDVLQRSVLQGIADFEVDAEEREEAQRFLKEQEALQARKREREAANSKSRQSPTSAKDAITLMDIDEPADQRAPVERRAKKSEAQRSLQDAFRTSFHQAQLKDAFRASFLNTQASYGAEDEEDPSLSVSPAPTPDVRSRTSAYETENAASSSSSSTSIATSEDDKTVLGRMSRMSLQEDEFDTLGH
ncbi:MACRO domain-containing protein 2-like protein [Aphelenchoides avenae]|nr:MACRO domain-containing protein 2-like protein [Aphelenchus avenae]